MIFTKGKRKVVFQEETYYWYIKKNTAGSPLGAADIQLHELTEAQLRIHDQMADASANKHEGQQAHGTHYYRTLSAEAEDEEHIQQNRDADNKTTLAQKAQNQILTSLQ